MSKNPDLKNESIGESLPKFPENESTGESLIQFPVKNESTGESEPKISVEQFIKNFQSEKGISYPTEIYSLDGKLEKIEFHDADNNFIIEALWDPRDKHTLPNYNTFRKWAYGVIKQKGYTVELTKEVKDER